MTGRIGRWVSEHRERILDNIASAATTLGLIAFGVALGVKWAAYRTAGEVPSPEFRASDLELALTAIYNSQIETALAVAGVGLLVGVGLSLRESLLETLREDVQTLREEGGE